MTSLEDLRNRFHEAHDAAVRAEQSGRPQQHLIDAAHDAYEELHLARAINDGFTDIADYDTWLALNAKRTIELSRRIREGDEP